MAKTMIGELYSKATDVKISNLYEDELGRMIADSNHYVGATLKELMAYCDAFGYTYQFSFGDDAICDSVEDDDEYGFLYEEADYCGMLDEQVKALFL